MGIRTDMAVEAHIFSRGSATEIDGIKLSSTKIGDITRTVVEVLDERGAKAIGKDKGKYITIDAPQIKYSTETYENVCNIISYELREMAENKKSVLVVGLGNDDITPDALGSETVKRLVVTTHMKKNMPEDISDDFGSLSAIVPGVMGDTGIETTEIVRGVVEYVKPDLIIAVDSLAGADINRVSTSIQISDAGISPGSGVGNHRKGLNESTLGVKVIAIGVPTVIAAEILSGGTVDEKFKSLMVTTKDIDIVIEKMSKTVANGINLAVHGNLCLKEIEEFSC